MIAAAVMQAAWQAGQRRVRLFCADELRPSACCIVDALHTRGYEVSLLTGPEARTGLQQPANAEVLRVIWAPEGADRATRSRLREALDPDAAGDVMVLAASTPRGVIEAIDAFGTPPRRSRLRGAPRKTFLAQPTLMERKIETKHWATSALGAGVIAGLLAFGIGFGARPPATAAEHLAATPAREAMSSPKAAIDEQVLASSRAPISFDDIDDDDDDDDDDEIIVFEEAPRRERVVAAPQPESVEVVPRDAAPLDAPVSAVAAAAPPVMMLATGMPGAAMPSAGPLRAIDPFE